jgi:carbamoyltransferase
MYSLGISAFYHDSAACLLNDGVIVAAAQEERFTRIKHDDAFPQNAIQYCLAETGISPSQIDHVTFYEKPFLKFERLIETYLAFAPRGFKSFAASMPLWVKDKLFQKKMLCEALAETLTPEICWRDRLLFSEHHLSHAASAFFPSPFDEAAILTMDGVGEWATSSVAIGRGASISVEREIHFPHSLGLLYSAFTSYAGFKVNSGEYKLMGLAPYGEPRFAELIKSTLVDIKDDGSFRLDMKYFSYCTGMTMTNRHFHTLFGGPPSQAESEPSQRDMDIAASIQSVTEEIVLKICTEIARETGQKNLCLAGGVALNCVANGKLREAGLFENIWVQPAAGDAGGALGAALVCHHMHLQNPRAVTLGQDRMSGAYLGPDFADQDAASRLQAIGAKFEILSPEERITRTAQALSEGKCIGWMNGRMEFGPRALGARSILADPRRPEMQKQLNLKIKFRESFRPFAPSVLVEHARDYFDLDSENPYMLFTADVTKARRHKPETKNESDSGLARLYAKRSDIPAVTHIDYSARVQTVDARSNPDFHALLSAFHDLTDCPVLINTSFNVRGEPIVCTPEDAFYCFMGTGLDMLVIGNLVLTKDQQNKVLVRDYKDRYELD